MPGAGGQRTTKGKQELGRLCQQILESGDAFSEGLSVFEHRARLLLDPVYGRPFGAPKRSPKILLNAREIREAFELLLSYAYGRPPTAKQDEENEGGARIQVHIHVPRPLRDGETQKAIAATLRALPEAG